MKDKNRFVISKTIEYSDESNPDKKYKIIIIARDDMLSDLKNNQINEFFMDCTYKMVPQNKNNFRLMMLCGYYFQKIKT